MSLTATLLLGRPITLPPAAAIRSHRISDADPRPLQCMTLPAQPLKLNKNSVRGMASRSAVAEALRNGPADINAIVKASGLPLSSARRWLLDMISVDEARRYRGKYAGKWIYELTEAME